MLEDSWVTGILCDRSFLFFCGHHGFHAIAASGAAATCFRLERRHKIVFMQRKMGPPLQTGLQCMLVVLEPVSI